MRTRLLSLSFIFLAAACSSNAGPGFEEGGGEIFNGSSASGWIGSGDASMKIDIAKDDSDNSALSVSGDEATNATFSLAIDPGAATGSAGVSFRVRGSMDVRFSATTSAVVPTENGGACDSASSTCWDIHGAALDVSTEWQTVKLDWAFLSQEGFGTPVTFDPAALTYLNWSPSGSGVYNIWIDDIDFYSTPQGNETGTGGSSAGTGGAESGSGGTTTGTGGTTNTSEHRLGKYVDLGMFLTAFNGKDPKYTYQALLDAVDLFPDFASCCNDTGKKREIAAFLAHVQHESDYLHATEEYTPPSIYCQASGEFPCAAGKSYHGRGALQLTWNYNYKFAQDYFASIGKVYSPSLLDVPEQVATNEELLWTTALWFWMVGDPSFVNDTMHDRLQAQGFGATIRKINGALECDGAGPQQVQQRVDYYTEWCTRLGIDPGTDLYC